MNPFQVLSVIACCVAVFVGVVTFLSMQGVPLPLAVLSVYLVAVGCMLGMQRRARESCEGIERGPHLRSVSSRSAGGANDVETKGEGRRTGGYTASGLQESFRSGS